MASLKRVGFFEKFFFSGNIECETFAWRPHSKFSEIAADISATLLQIMNFLLATLLQIINLL